jgi:hypothetical protein
MRLLYNQPLSTHPNPSLKKGGAPLRCKFGALSPSLFQGGGQGVGTLNAYARIVCGLLGLGQNAGGLYPLPFHQWIRSPSSR